MRKSEFYALTSNSSISNLTQDWLEKANSYNEQLSQSLEYYSSGSVRGYWFFRVYLYYISFLCQEPLEKVLERLRDELAENTTQILQNQAKLDSILSSDFLRYEKAAEPILSTNRSLNTTNRMSENSLESSVAKIMIDLGLAAKMRGM